jgi:hypothetical protein
VTTLKNKKTVSSQFAKYIGPVLQAIRELGGSGRPDEVRMVIARNLGISDAEQSEPLPSGVQTRFENQVHWARFYLAKAGYIDSSQRGVWTLTEKGRSLGEVTPDEIQRIIREVSERTKTPSGGAPEPGLGTSDTVPLVADYREELAQTLQSLPLPGSSDFANDCCANPVFKKLPLLADPETVASTVSACFRSTPSSVSKFSFNARSTLGRSRQATYAISAAQ